MDVALAPVAPAGRFEFRVGTEVASLVDGEVRREAVDDPDVVVEGDPASIYDMFVNRCLDGVTVTGDRDLLERLVAAPPRGSTNPSRRRRHRQDDHVGSDTRLGEQGQDP